MYTIFKRLFPGILVLIFLETPFQLRSQETEQAKEVPDSIAVKLHSPRKATLYSVMLPGLGQAYNKKYWKIPIIYAGFGVLTYFIVTSADDYLTYQCAYIEKVYGNTNGNYKDLVNKYTEDELMSAREYYRRNLEISILISGVWYALNIIDAAVDAHLYTYNISKDLTLNVAPMVIPPVDQPGFTSGIRLTFKF